MAGNKNRGVTSGICDGCGRQYATLAASSCAQCGGSIVAARDALMAEPSWLSLPPLCYPGTYTLFVLLAALDVILTFLILEIGGLELNAVAGAVIAHLGLPGAIAFKFALVVFIVIMCEVIGRHRDRTGRKLAEWSAAVTAIPVAVAAIQLLVAG